MLLVLFFAMITLVPATANNVSSKPSDNKVSSSLFGVRVKVKRRNKKEKNENSADDIVAKHRSLLLDLHQDSSFHFYFTCTFK